MVSDVVEWSLTATCAVVFALVIFFYAKKWKKSEGVGVDLLPSPKKLPIIGNLHLVSDPPFRSFRDLSQQYGPIMHLKLGGVDAVVVSSPEIAKEILKDNDPVYTNRPESIALKIFWYNYINIAFSPYGGYWKQMRKICTLELLSPKSVRSFGSIRKDEVSRLVDSVRLSAGETINLTQKVFSMTSSVTCRAAFGKVCRDKDSLIKLVKQGLDMGAGSSIADTFPSSVIAHALSWRTKRRLMKMRRKLDVILDGIIREHETNRKDSGRGNGEFGNEDLVDVLLRVMESGELEFPIGYDNIKAVLFDMFAGGTETSSSTIDWAMTELVRNPQVMAKAQAEIRQVVKERGGDGVEEEDVQKLKYLRLVIMETLRLHPQGSILARVPREARRISGYNIPVNVIVVVNVWAIHRDPKHWLDPESFKPERFANEDIIGSDFRYLPFGNGKRMCPGITFGWASVALPLAQLLYNFNWELPAGVDAQALNMLETSGLTTSRIQNLFLVATHYQP
ncbi:premnaspirodiene oxygenase-like [Salvia miltiorrhiza]|uniref:premnaspirodiene oxygenase-like n=1 Tax=Salvia miltiorrhiza TaxID=226208 RepID=UPI0025AB7C44|nr:premnaspirodiene oxygenase-like [Salvia miltiorrhiza]